MTHAMSAAAIMGATLLQAAGQERLPHILPPQGGLPARETFRRLDVVVDRIRALAAAMSRAGPLQAPATFGDLRRAVDALLSTYRRDEHDRYWLGHVSGLTAESSLAPGNFRNAIPPEFRAPACAQVLATAISVMSEIQEQAQASAR